MAGLYLHIPFCRKACHYCDFHFSTSRASKSEFCKALALEIVLQKDYLKGMSVDTIYFGGGTPSLLHFDEIENILSSINENYLVSSNVEITMEANPDDLTAEKLIELNSLGINRLSIGIQTFDENILKFLNRSHTSQMARSSIQLARKYGFENINIDLIYAIPGLTSELWKETILEAVKFSPKHISAYSLTIEKKTVFGNWSKNGTLTTVSEEVASEQMEMLMETLEAFGYEQYEISNFCQSKFYSKHNSSYWKQSIYLGLGPSAHSFDGNSRQFNIQNNALYIKALNNNTVPFEREILTRENKINEYILTSIRTNWGCDLNFLRLTYDDNTFERCKTYLDKYIEDNLIEMKGDKLFLTRKGKLFADKITEDLMVD